MEQFGPRFLVWAGIYGGLALVSAGVLYWQQGALISPLLGIYVAAGVALAVDAIAVFHRGQKSTLNELVTFAAVCLSAPLAYVATVGTLSPTIVGLWGLCTLYFSSTIFTVKLRKPHQGKPASAPLQRTIAYHAIALMLFALREIIPDRAWNEKLLRVSFWSPVRSPVRTD